MTKQNDPWGLPNEDKYDAAAAARATYGSDFGTDERFAPISDDRPNSLLPRVLKLANAEDADAEVQRVLREGGISHVDDDKPHRVTFHVSGRGTVEADLHRRGNEWSTVVAISGEPLKFKSADRDALIGLVNRALNPGSRFRDLSETERLELAYLAGSGALEETLNRYFQYRCGNAEVNSHDPAFQQVANESAWFVFIHSTPEFVDYPEARAYFHRHIGNRPVTLPLLKAAFRAWREAEKNDPPEPQPAAAPEPEPLPNLETLTDEDVKALYGATVRDRAQKIRNALRL